jgi:hypothetical protein
LGQPNGPSFKCQENPKGRTEHDPKGRTEHSLLSWDFVHCLISQRRTTFWKLAVFLFPAKEAPNLMNPLDEVILYLWATQKQ